MSRLLVVLLAPLLLLAASPIPASAVDDSDVRLSPELSELLRQEMVEIQSGMTRLVPALASGDWEAVAAIADGIEGSFVLKRSLTPELKAEIGTLPDEFRRLDRAFHGTGGALAGAAREGDAELAVFYTSRLLEGCTSCHGRFASARFPGLK